MAVKDINGRVIKANDFLINDESGEMAKAVLVEHTTSGKLDMAVQNAAFTTDEWLSDYPDGFWRVID